MALHWNLTKIKDTDNVCWREITLEDGSIEQRMNQLTETMIWLCAGVGIGEITEKNAQQFHCRVNLLEQLNGPFLYQNKEPRPITIEDVRSHIGLSTNVSNTPKGKWLIQVTRNWRHL